jgi:hypothetical protein
VPGRPCSHPFQLPGTGGAALAFAPQAYSARTGGTIPKVQLNPVQQFRRRRPVPDIPPARPSGWVALRTRPGVLAGSATPAVDRLGARRRVAREGNNAPASPHLPHRSWPHALQGRKCAGEGRGDPDCAGRRAGITLLPGLPAHRHHPVLGDRHHLLHPRLLRQPPLPRRTPPRPQRPYLCAARSRGVPHMLIPEAQPPREWAERLYDIHRWTVMPRGGHCAPPKNPSLSPATSRAFFGAMDR